MATAVLLECTCLQPLPSSLPLALTPSTSCFSSLHFTFYSFLDPYDIITLLPNKDMSPKKRNSTKGSIIFHAPIQPGLFSSENYVTDSQIDMAIRRSPPQPSVEPNNSSKNQREESNEGRKSPKPTPPPRPDRLSCPSIRRLQAKMETENRQTRETMEQLLNTENGFIKELEKVLNQHDVAEQRRRERLHKQWTERQWLPLQKQLHQRVSSCSAIDIKRRQSCYSHFLQHCNSKGHVFLDTYNLKEYDPFFHTLKSSHHLKLTEMKNSIKEAWMPHSTEADSSKSSRQDKPPYHFQSSLVSSRSVSCTQRRTPSSYTTSTSTNKEGTAAKGTCSSRFEKIPCHTDTKYRDCHRSDRWFSPRSEL